MYFLLNSSVANSFLFCFFSSRAVLLLPPSLSLSLCPLYTPLPQPTPPHPRTHTCSRFLTLEMVSDQRLSLSWRLDEWVQRDRLLKSSYCIDCLWYQVSAHREFNCKKKKSIYSKSKQSSYFISAMVATCTPVNTLWLQAALQPNPAHARSVSDKAQDVSVWSTS